MIYKVTFSNVAIKQSKFLSLKNKALLEKVVKVMDSILQDPRKGLGKPERLKHYEEEIYFRRIDKKNRLVYKIEKNQIIVLSILEHYKSF